MEAARLGRSFCLCYFLAMSTTLLYRCPNTGRTVQGWSADKVTDDNDDDTYRSFECTFCTRLHLVNLKTGKVLGGKRTRPAPSSACRFGSVYSLLNLLVIFPYTRADYL
jgi:hypothetical protein